MSKYLKFADGKLLCTTSNKLIDIIGSLLPVEPFKYADTYRLASAESLSSIEYIGPCIDFINSSNINGSNTGFGSYCGEFETVSDSTNTLTCKIRAWDTDASAVYASFIDVITSTTSLTCFGNLEISSHIYGGAYIGTGNYTGNLPIAISLDGYDGAWSNSESWWQNFFTNNVGLTVSADSIKFDNSVSYYGAGLWFFTYDYNANLNCVNVTIHRLQDDAVIDLEFLGLGSNLSNTALNKLNLQSNWKNLLSNLDNTNHVTKINYTTDTDYNNFSNDLEASMVDFPISPELITKIYGPAFAFRDYSSARCTNTSNSDFSGLICCNYTIGPRNWANLSNGLCTSSVTGDVRLFSATAFTGAIWDNTDAFKLSSDFVVHSAYAFAFENAVTQQENSVSGGGNYATSTPVRLEIVPSQAFLAYNYSEIVSNNSNLFIPEPVTKDFIYSMLNGLDGTGLDEMLVFGDYTAVNSNCNFTDTDWSTSVDAPYEIKTGYTPTRSSSQYINFTFYTNATTNCSNNLSQVDFYISDSYSTNAKRGYVIAQSGFTMPECQSRFISFPLAPLWKQSDGGSSLASFQSIIINIETNAADSFYEDEHVFIFWRHMNDSTYQNGMLYLINDMPEDIGSAVASFTGTLDINGTYSSKIAADGIENDSIVILFGTADPRADYSTLYNRGINIIVTTA